MASILVVDDEINICRILDRLLTREGHVVDTALGAELALEKVKIKTYDLVLMDLRMPGMNGIDLYAELKAFDPRYESRVVFITGDVISPKNREFLEHAGARYIAKPFTGDALLHRVNSTLGGE